MSEYVVGKNPCKRCQKEGKDRSGNNFHWYGEGKGGTCFSCGYTVPSDDWLRENGKWDEEEEWEDIVGLEFNEEVHNKIKARTGTDSKDYRGIPEAISKWFGVRYEYSEEDGSVAQTLYPCTKGYTLSGYKVRSHPKDFSTPGPYGETGKDCDLFMQFRFKNSGGKYVLICSGEHDALAAFTMLKGYTSSKGQDYPDIPVVSSTIGESGSHKQIQSQYSWLNGFDRVVICYDQDDAGKKSLEKLSKVLPKGKMYVMSLPLKDANDMLLAGKQKEFVNMFFRAKAYTPDGIVGSGELLDKIKQAAVVPKVPLPPFMHKVQDMMAGGIPLGVITNLGSASGTGKSTIIDECVYYWVFNSPHKVGVVSLESDCAQYGTKLLSRHIGRKIDLISNMEYKIEFLNSEEVSEKAQELFFNEDGSHRWLLVEERDGGVDSLKELVMSLIIEGECKVIILDPLQDIIDALSNEEQANFMKWQKGLVKSHGVTFVNVNHVRKSTGGTKANSTGADIHEEDFHGNSSIFKSSACNLLFTRNKEAESEVERNTTRMKMTKCRWTGRTGPEAGMYYYDNETHTLHDLDDWLLSHPQAVNF